MVNFEVIERICLTLFTAAEAGLSVIGERGEVGFFIAGGVESDRLKTDKPRFGDS